MKLRQYFYGALGCFLLFAACKKSDTAATATGNAHLMPLQYILDNNYSFSSFDTLLKKTGYYQNLTQDSVFTLMVPDNNAFTSAGFRIDSLLALNPDSLKRFVSYHILRGSIVTSNVPQTISNPRMTLLGNNLYISKPIITSDNASSPDVVRQFAHTMHINGIYLRQTDLLASNGAIQVLAAPLRTPYPTVKSWLLSKPGYSLLTTALRKFNLLDQLDSTGPWTIFAPNNDALIRNNVDFSRVNSDTFDLKHYKAYLFNAGIFPGRIFMFDFNDASIPNNLAYRKDGTIVFWPSNQGPLGITVTSYWSSQGPGSTSYSQIGGFPNAALKDQQPAINGVIFPVNDILVYPDSVYIGGH